MSLEMHASCEGCGADLAPGGSAFIRGHECTFCENCADGMGRVCPNCGGELVRRPRREEG